MAFVRDYDAAPPSATEVAALPGLTLVEFGTPWCGHCIAAQPLLEAALRGDDGIRHLKVEDGRGRPLGRAFSVRLWPTLVLLRDGVEAARAVRPTRQQDVARLLAASATASGAAAGTVPPPAAPSGSR